MSVWVRVRVRREFKECMVGGYQCSLLHYYTTTLLLLHYYSTHLKSLSHILLDNTMFLEHS
jgi:hypothetical protein